MGKHPIPARFWDSEENFVSWNLPPPPTNSPFWLMTPLMATPMAVKNPKLLKIYTDRPFLWGGGGHHTTLGLWGHGLAYAYYQVNT